MAGHHSVQLLRLGQVGSLPRLSPAVGPPPRRGFFVVSLDNERDNLVFSNHIPLTIRGWLHNRMTT